MKTKCLAFIALAAANKRIANILRKAAEGGIQEDRKVDPDLLTEPQESALHQAVCLADSEIKPMLARRDYQVALVRLAELQAPVDAFFDAVMVMTEDIQVKNNRLALLATVKGLFDNIADISRLVIEKN